jgi:xeroderma pigmentosum group C-complementing protein
MDWEEVGLRKDGVEETAEEDVEDEKPMELVLDTGDVRSPRRGTARRKPSTAIEKKMRLEVHKTHLLCLLAHVHLRNNGAMTWKFR